MQSIGSVPAPVDLIKKCTAWNNSETMMHILTKLNDALDHIENKQIILITDTAKSHISPKVIEFETSLSIWLCIAPTDVTWLLQPLDVRVFSRYKRYLRNEFRDCLIEHGGVTDHQ